MQKKKLHMYQIDGSEIKVKDPKYDEPVRSPDN